MQEILEKLESLEKMIREQSILQKEVLDFEEACLYVGRSKQNMYKLTSKNKIPHYKPEGKKICFKRSELDAWRLRNPVKTIDDIDSEAETYTATT